MSKLLTILSLLLTITACTAPTGLFKNREQANLSLAATVKYCQNLDIANPLQILGGKWGKNNGADGKPSIQQLSDKSLATEKEKIAISQIADVQISCEEKFQSWAKENAPAASSLIDEYIIQMKQITAALYGRQISFGEANTKKMNLDLGLIQALKQLDAQLYARQKSEQDQLINTLLLLNGSGTAPSAPPRAVNCFSSGNMTTCN